MAHLEIDVIQLYESAARSVNQNPAIMNNTAMARIAENNLGTYASMGHQSFVSHMTAQLAIGAFVSNARSTFTLSIEGARTTALMIAGMIQQMLSDQGRLNPIVPAREDFPPDPSLGPGRMGDPGNLHLKGAFPFRPYAGLTVDVVPEEEREAKEPASLNVDISQNTNGLDESLGFNTETGQHTVATPGMASAHGVLGNFNYETGIYNNFGPGISGPTGAASGSTTGAGVGTGPASAPGAGGQAP